MKLHIYAHYTKAYPLKYELNTSITICIPYNKNGISANTNTQWKNVTIACRYQNW